MPYPPLNLQCVDRRVAATISMFTEPSLREAHNLLCTAFPNGDAPGHFGRAAAIMTLVSIAATSGVRYLDLSTNRPLKGHFDKDIFPATVVQFFPWSAIGITDKEYKAMGSKVPRPDLHEEVAKILYGVLRNPLMHTGGAVAKGFPTVGIRHIFPGLSFQENDAKLCDFCSYSTLHGEEVLSFDRFGAVVTTRGLYWAARKMIEAFAADLTVQADIKKNHRFK